MPESTPTIVVCHGLTGGSHESYVRNVLAWVIRPVAEGGLGVRAVVINVCPNPPFYKAIKLIAVCSFEDVSRPYV
jgi:hypothetical protein